METQNNIFLLYLEHILNTFSIFKLQFHFPIDIRTVKQADEMTQEVYWHYFFLLFFRIFERNFT